MLLLRRLNMMCMKPTYDIVDLEMFVMKDYKSCNKLDNQMNSKFDYESFVIYESCIMDRLLKSLCSRTGEQAQGILELIHFDVCGDACQSQR